MLSYIRYSYIYRATTYNHMVRKDPSQRRQLRPFSLSPEVNAYLDTLPDRQKSALVERLLREHMEKEKQKISDGS